MDIKTVFHPSDFTRGDEGAFAHALRMALTAKGELQLLHVRESDEPADWSQFPRVRATLAVWGILPPEATHGDVARLGLDVAKVQRTGTNVAAKIEEHIQEHRPDLIVLATHQRHGLDRWLHRPVAEPIARRSKSMTLFVPRRVVGFVNAETGRVRLRTILIPIDRSPSPQLAVDAAAAVARTLQVPEVHFILLYVGTEADMPDPTVPVVPGWSSERRSWPGPVVDHLLSAAETDDVDLIVMTTHGHDGFLDALRGSTTERVLRETRCPLLAVPAS